MACLADSRKQVGVHCSNFYLSTRMNGLPVLRPSPLLKTAAHRQHMLAMSWLLRWRCAWQIHRWLLKEEEDVPAHKVEMVARTHEGSELYKCSSSSMVHWMVCWIPSEMCSCSPLHQLFGSPNCLLTEALSAHWEPVHVSPTVMDSPHAFGEAHTCGSQQAEQAPCTRKVPAK